MSLIAIGALAFTPFPRPPCVSGPVFGALSIAHVAALFTRFVRTASPAVDMTLAPGGVDAVFTRFVQFLSALTPAQLSDAVPSLQLAYVKPVMTAFGTLAAGIARGLSQQLLHDTVLEVRCVSQPRCLVLDSCSFPECCVRRSVQLRTSASYLPADFATVVVSFGDKSSRCSSWRVEKHVHSHIQAVISQLLADGVPVVPGVILPAFSPTGAGVSFCVPSAKVRYVPASV